MWYYHRRSVQLGQVLQQQNRGSSRCVQVVVLLLLLHQHPSMASLSHAGFARHLIRSLTECGWDRVVLFSQQVCTSCGGLRTVEERQGGKSVFRKEVQEETTSTISSTLVVNMQVNPLLDGQRQRRRQNAWVCSP
jgi:hypothetical protein